MRYGASTKLPPEKVIAKAKAYFVKLSLDVVTEGPECISLEGAGGSVTINAIKANDTEVEIHTTGLDHKVKHFLQMIG